MNDTTQMVLRPQHRNPAVRLVVAALIAIAGLLWMSPGMCAPRPPSDVGLILQRQKELLTRTLAPVKPSPGRPQLYFVGFAGYGPQAVFKREVLAVRKLFDERYGTQGRSIALINNASTLREVPLATAANLQVALAHLGRVMDPEHDVLFLFLTSHGEEGRFVVEMPRFGLQHLNPEQLKRLLRQSGIRNSVVVLSACHSGSFIPALADATTLVITAARADRSSFGCDDRREWTYFGDAFFNYALRREVSFVRAFARAENLIKRWEAKAKLVPSLPQIAGGERLGPALAAIQEHH